LKSAFVEAALIRWFEDHFEGEASGAKRVAIHWPGERFEERTALWVKPRIAGFERPGDSRRGDEIDVLVLEVTCHVKVEPKGKRSLILSNLVDEARRLVDSSERATAQKILNEDGLVIGIIDFGPAQETRQYDVGVSIGGVTIPGVDLAVLRTRCLISRTVPRVP